MDASKRTDAIADLWYIAQYALAVRNKLIKEELSVVEEVYLDRMRDLTEKVHRELKGDTQCLPSVQKP